MAYPLQLAFIWANNKNPPQNLRFKREKDLVPFLAKDQDFASVLRLGRETAAWLPLQGGVGVQSKMQILLDGRFWWLLEEEKKECG